MKIALLSEKYTPDTGGLAISAGRIARLVAQAGHNIHVFAPSPNLPPSDKHILIHDGVRTVRFGAHKRAEDTLVDWSELLIQEHMHAAFDGLHAYFLPQAGFVAAYTGRYMNIPSVVSIRGNDIERAAFDPGKFSHMLYALQNAGALTTNTSELVRKAHAFIDREVVLIPIGIDATSFKPASRNEALAELLGLGNLSVVGFVGELREKNGLRPLLNAYAQIVREHPAALLIVGDVRPGEDRRAFEELQSSIPNSRIIITGYVPHPEISAYYSLIDVFVQPSLRDGLPNVLLEAMACGLGIVATSVGGMLDAIKHEENGLLVPINESGALAEAMMRVLENDRRRKQLGSNARETVIRKFTCQNELAGNLRLHQTLVQRI